MKIITLLVCLFPVSLFASSHQFKADTPIIYQTQVIADFGGVDVSHFLPSLESDNADRQRKIYEERRSKKLVQGHFPVRSKMLKVGRLTPDQAKDLKFEMVSQPIFMIGYDRVSMDWLKANRGHLSKNKAIGLVVNVETVSQMDELQAIAGRDIVLQPTPGDSIAEHLKIRNYPFYMDNKGVMR